jgi:hypothetical protein
VPSQEVEGLLETGRISIDVDGTTLGEGPLRRTIERALSAGEVRLTKTDDGWRVETPDEANAAQAVRAAMRRSGYNVID